MRAPTGGRLVGPAAVAALALACNLEKAPVGPVRLAFNESQTFAAPLVLRVVPPQATDPAIDRALDAHYVWLDTTARSNHE